MGGGAATEGDGGRQIKNLSHLGASSKATARKPVGGVSRVSGCRVQARRGTAWRVGAAEGVCEGCDGAPAAAAVTKKKKPDT